MSARQVSAGGGGGSSSTASDQPTPPAGSKKPSSGRSKGGSRAPSRSHGHPSEEDIGLRKRGHKDSKSRPPTQQPPHKEGLRSGSQHSSRTKDHHTGHHSSRHRGSSESGHRGSNGGADGGGNRTESRILSSNRFEKLDIEPERDSSVSVGSSLSGDSMSKSCSGDSMNKSSSSSISPSSSLNLPAPGGKGAEERGLTKDRSRNGRGSFRGKGAAGKFNPDSVEAGGDGAKSSGHSGPLKGDDGGQKKKSPKQITFDLPPDDGVNDLELDGQDPSLSAGVASSSSSTMDSGVGSGSDRSPPSEASGVSVGKKERIMYNKAILLSLRKVSQSFSPPPELEAFDLLLRPQLLFATEHPFKKDPISSSAEDSKPMKHPTALTLIKEHDKHSVGKVSLSPQRGSFQRGCSWKDRVSSENSDGSLKTPPPGHTDSPHFKYDGQKSQATGRPNGPRVINHVPLRDQEQKLGNKKNWRSTYKKEDYVEPEPEWMEFGPTDRFEVIELKGFEEHEEKKEDKEPDVSPEEPASQADGPTDSPVKKKASPEKEQPVEITNSDPQTSAAPAESQAENEFILDGFDFSTGVSICQALDLDEDEAPSPTADKSPLMLSNKEATDPSALLLKALGVPTGETKAAPTQHKASTGINSKVVVSAAPPANALTLDEIQAREDIPPSPAEPPKDTASVGEGMEAFNKLLAVLESKKPKEPPLAQKYSDPAPGLQQRGRVPRPEPQASPGFSYPLDKELLNIEEDISAPNVLFPEPNLRRLEQLGRMLETMDRMDPTTAQLYDYPPASRPPPQRLHQMEQRVPMHPSQMEREGGRGWMYPQEPRGRNHPTPQQLAAARQHQMLTNARSNANNWAVEMEQRRLMELRQMQLAEEKELFGGRAPPPTGGMPPQSYKPQHASKPNISLLPTAVMRHMHTSKPGQAGSDLPKTNSISSRLDQDLTNKASQTHSMLNSLLSQTQDFSGPPSDYPVHGHHYGMPAGMRMVPQGGQNVPKPSDLPPSGSVYPHYNVPSHGMPVHNPYMY